MRITIWLMLVLVAAVAMIMLASIVLTHQQRRELLREEITRDTEALGRALQAGLNHALRQRARIAGLDELLRAAIADPETFATVLLDPAGNPLAGEGAHEGEILACLQRHVPGPRLASGEARGWVSCNPDVYWVALPVLPPASVLVVAQRGGLLEDSVAAELQRQPLLLFALLLTIVMLIPLVLHGRLVTPLTQILRGIRMLGKRGEMPRIRLDSSTGEVVQLAAALDQLAEQLAGQRHELVSRTEEKLALERRLREAEKFAVIGRLSGGLAHELGSPLSVIAIRAQAIQFMPGAPPAVREHAGIIHAQVRRVTDFIQGLLHIAQKQGVVFNPLDLAELLHEVLDELAPWARTEEVQLELKLPDRPVIAHGDRTLLRHAVRNLVRNSLHALNEHVGERRVQVRLEPEEHEIRVLVEDSGPGIPEAQLTDVFQPFYTTKGMGQGMGLGLPITRAIIEEHGGELYLENLEHSGLRAVMALPVVRGDGAMGR
jgi:two-component system, NtrC family, sensor kinase